MALPRAVVRRAVTRMEVAVERAAPVRTVKVRGDALQVPNSTSLVESMAMAVPSAVVAAPMATGAAWALVMEGSAATAARAAASATPRNWDLASWTRA